MRLALSRTLAFVALAGWAILCVAALAGFLYEVSMLAGPDELGVLAELETKLTLQLLILNFPISLLPVVLSPLLPDFGIGPIFEWAMLVFLGLLQWTILAPLVIRRTRQAWASFEEAE